MSAKSKCTFLLYFPQIESQSEPITLKIRIAIKFFCDSFPPNIRLMHGMIKTNKSVLIGTPIEV